MVRGKVAVLNIASGLYRDRLSKPQVNPALMPLPSDVISSERLSSLLLATGRDILLLLRSVRHGPSWENTTLNQNLDRVHMQAFSL